VGRPSVSTTRSWRRWACRRAGAVPKGAISHWVAKTDDGTRVVDVWETRAEYDRFAKEKIGSYAKEVGFEREPTIRFYDVHSYPTLVSREALGVIGSTTTWGS